VILERGEAPLSPPLPLPLLREGGQGDRLLNNLFIAILTKLLGRDRIPQKETVGESNIEKGVRSSHDSKNQVRQMWHRG